MIFLQSISEPFLDDLKKYACSKPVNA